MTLISLGFLLGVMVLQQCASLPSVKWSGLLVVLIPSLFALKKFRFPIVVICGFLWALWQAHARLYPELKPEWEGIDLLLEGVVVSIPEQRGRATRFLFDIHRLKVNNQWQDDFQQRVRLSWYDGVPSLRLGQAWRLTARLKRPWGFRNPGGFDYEGWLYRQGVRATGYVRKAATARSLPNQGLTRPLDGLRQWLAEGIAESLGRDINQGVVTALAIGERSSISPQQWKLLLATGTNHLLAISGLHIGLVAGLVFALTLRVWRLWGRLCLLWPAQQIAALAAILAACGYAMLAGFSVPSQRAMIMLCVVMGAVLLNRSLRPGHTLGVALLLVLIWDSIAVLSPGFWLSFAAVAVILYTLCGRRGLETSWWQWGRVQWVLAVGLLPLTLVFFQRASLIAPLANLLAVPFVGLIIVPTILLGVVLLLTLPSAGQVLLGLASGLLEILWSELQAMAELPFAQWFHAPPAWTLLPAVVGIVVVLAPNGWPARWLGLVLLAPLVFVNPARPDSGAYWLTLLDVGQGLSAVIETRNHTLVYDTGAKFSEFFNAGEAVVVPFLRSRGVGSVDLLVISHGDNDHIGGIDAVLANLRVRRILTSEPSTVNHRRVGHCLSGLNWHWDGVDFEMLHPNEDWQDSDNNRSCVLHIQNPGGSVLLTADIELGVESRLLETYGSRLTSDIMLIPHHGSLTSSSPAFLDAVDPDLALLPVGYRNRFGFPNPDVIDRYSKLGISILDTLSQGAIKIGVHPSEGIEIHQGYRQSDKRYWSAVP